MKACRALNHAWYIARAQQEQLALILFTIPTNADGYHQEQQAAQEDPL
jgi:hypothetical protein